MRIPLPTRFHPKPVIIFALVLFLLQQAQGTVLSFSLLSFLYIIIFATSFNGAGGLERPSGAFIFFTGTLTCIVGLVYKGLLGEAAQTLLLSPNTTMEVYCAGMVGLGLAAVLSNRLLPKGGVLTTFVPDEKLRRVAVGCVIISTILRFAGSLLPLRVETGLAQLNHFDEMAILLSTYYEVRASGGRRSSSWITWVAAASIFVNGLLSFSKQGLFTPLFAWLFPCLMLRFNFSLKQVLGLACAIAFGLYYLVPYSQYGRSLVDADSSFRARTGTSIQLISNLTDTRRRYIDSVSYAISKSEAPKYYKGDQGLFDRLQMLAFDDALIDETDNRGPIGLFPTYLDYINLIPHVFYPNKPNLNWGNAYAHEIGLLSRDDYTTGISFSPAADAYHQAGWEGVLLLLPGTAFLLFLITDWISGDVRRAPWGLLLVVIYAHTAPEGLLVEIIYFTVYGPLMMILVALAAGRAFPFVADLLFKRKDAAIYGSLPHPHLVPGARTRSTRSIR